MFGPKKSRSFARKVNMFSFQRPDTKTFKRPDCITGNLIGVTFFWKETEKTNLMISKTSQWTLYLFSLHF